MRPVGQIGDEDSACETAQAGAFREAYEDYWRHFDRDFDPIRNVVEFERLDADQRAHDAWDDGKASALGAVWDPYAVGQVADNPHAT